MTTALLERPVATVRPAPDDDESVPPGEVGRDADPKTGSKPTEEPVDEPGESGPTQPAEPRPEDTTPGEETAPKQPGE